MKKLLFSAIATASMLAFTAPSQAAFLVNLDGGSGCLAGSFPAGSCGIPAIGDSFPTRAADNTTRSVVGIAGQAMNTSFGGAGFSNFFSSDYGLLGGLSTGIANSSAFNSGSSSAYSSSFTTASAAPTDNISITFDYAFSGNTPGTDSANVFFFDVDNGGANDVFVTSLSVYGSQAGASFLLPAILFNPAINYQFAFQLSETANSNLFNSAFGFDNITVQSQVPFEFSPALGVLGLAGLFGANQFRKKIAKRKQAVDVNSIG